MEMQDSRRIIANKNQEVEDDEVESKKPSHNKNSLMRLSHLPSSRIYRVSRATGGKDRHSKVYTAKGLRDRRIRLSVSTAIQFYDLQDRLGYDQPSKAIEWLIKAAENAISELPSLESCFSNIISEPVQNEAEVSTSETSKGSGLSLSRSEMLRIKGKENQKNIDVGLNSEGSFTKLLTGGSTSELALNGVQVTTSEYFPSGYSSQMDMQRFAFFQEHYRPEPGGDYDLNFSISPGVSGFHRGTLQSNSPSHHHHQLHLSQLHHHNHHQHGPFYFSDAANALAAAPTESPFAAGFEGQLQLYGGYKQVELKGKRKN